MLESEGFNPVKIGIFAAILAVFGVVGYIATSSNGSSKPVQTAHKAPGAADDKIASAAPAPADMPAAAPAPADAAVASNNSAASSQPAQPAAAASADEPVPAAAATTSSVAANSPATESAQPAPSPVASSSASANTSNTSSQPQAQDKAGSEQIAASGSTSAGDQADAPKHHNASKKVPAHIAANAPPSALAALTPWWTAPTASTFKVAAVGDFAGGNGVVVVFNDDVSDPAAAGQKLQLMDSSGVPISAGSWEAGDNRRVLVHKDLPVGNYRLAIDPSIASASGQTLGRPIQGPVFVQ